MLAITSVDHIDGTDILVEFSDGTSASFTVEQLVELAPSRQSRKDTMGKFEMEGFEGED